MLGAAFVAFLELEVSFHFFDSAIAYFKPADKLEVSFFCSFCMNWTKNLLLFFRPWTSAPCDDQKLADANTEITLGLHACLQMGR